MTAPYQTVRRAWREWEAIGATPFALRQIRFGASLPWTSPPATIPRRFANAYPMSAANAKFAELEVNRWVARGYAQEISFSEAQKQHIVSSAFVVNGTKDRLVIDYAAFVNPYLSAPKFRMETLLDLAPQLQPNDSLFKIDLADGYYHVGYRTADRTYLAFRVGRRFFIPLCLNCGLKAAPFIFTKWLRPMVQELRRLQHSVISYLDDVGGAPRVGLAEGPHATEANTKVAKSEVLSLASRLGVQIHQVKRDFSGTKELELLGILVDTKAGLYILSPTKLNKVRASALEVHKESRRRRRLVRIRHLRSFAGLAQSTALAVTDARLHLRAIWDSIAGGERRGRGQAKLSHQACRDLLWWIKLRDNSGVGRAIWAPPADQTRLLHSDANSTGWGAVFGGSVPARGLFTPAEATLHFNQKELLAVIFGVLAFADRLQPGEHITQWVDSSVTTANILNWTSRSPVALALLRILRNLLEDLGLSISTQRLPSVLNLLSDRLSRARTADDWQLSTTASSFLSARLGHPRVHHFAMRLTAVARRYTSRLADPYAEGLAFHSRWRAGDLLTPPPHALSLVVARLRRRMHDDVVLVTPDWPAQPWFAAATRLASRSWRLPFPTWTRGQQSSQWAGRAFLIGRGSSENKLNRLKDIHKLPLAYSPRQRTGSMQQQKLLPTGLEAGSARIGPRGCSALPSRSLPHRDTAATGIDLYAFADKPGSPHYPLLKKRSPATSAICLTARQSLEAVFGNTLRPSRTGTPSAVLFHRRQSLR